MEPKYQPGEKVELVILKQTDLGFVAQVNGIDRGLLYHSEIFQDLREGQKLPGYIKKVREDGAIDLLLQPFGNFGAGELGEKILQVLRDHGGVLQVNDKTPPERIYDLFGVSKKKFKIALGGLYKKKQILITDKGIQLVKEK